MKKLANGILIGIMVGLALAIPVAVYMALDTILYAVKITVIFIAVVGLLILAYIGFVRWQNERHQQYRVIDGSFPLQRHKLPTGDWIVVDPNKVPGAAYVIGPSVGYREVESSVGAQVQMVIDQAVQQTRSLAAVAVGDHAFVRTKGMIAQPKLPASITKMMPKPPKLDAPTNGLPALDPPAPPAIVHTPIPTQQMIASPSAQTTELAIGENPDGGIVNVDLLTFPFLRIHGATRHGKTALALLLVAQALRHGYEVDIYDNRNGKDWGIFSQHANVIDSRDPAVLIDGLTAEMRRYKERDDQLGKHGVADLHDLAAATGQAYPRRLIVIEEMGNQTLNIKNKGKEAYTRFVNALRKITTEAGATGIHGLYIDQVPTVWDPTVRYNAAMICFYLPDHGGKVAGYPAAFQLEKYHCHFEGQVIRAGHLTDDQIRQTINHVPARQEGTPTGVNTPTNTPNTNTPANTPDDWVRANEEAARQYIAANEEAGVNDLARHLAYLNNRPDEWRNYQSEASRWWNTYHPNGKLYQSQTISVG